MEQELIRNKKGFATLRHLGRVEQEGSGTEADKGTRGFADAAPFRQSRTEREPNRRGVEQKQVQEQEGGEQQGNGTGTDKGQKWFRDAAPLRQSRKRGEWNRSQ